MTVDAGSPHDLDAQLPSDGASLDGDADSAVPNDAATSWQELYCGLEPPLLSMDPPIVWTEPASDDRFGMSFGPTDFGAAWTQGGLFVWGGDQVGSLTCPGPVQGSANYGSIYDLESRVWRALPSEGAPAGRHQPHVIGAGDEVYVWGGFDDPIETLSSGGIYSLRTDSWREMTVTGAPPRGCRTVPVWANDRLLVWLGDGEGHVYEPITDRWTPIRAQGAPRGPAVNAAWTSHELIVTSSIDFSSSDDVHRAAAYDPIEDSWRELAAPPFEVTDHALIWTGAQLLLFGFDGIALYDPCTDVWSALEPPNVEPLVAWRSLWAGDQLLIWGFDASDTPLAYRYDPQLERFTPEPSIDRWVTAVWTGEQVLVPVHHAL